MTDEKTKLEVVTEKFSDIELAKAPKDQLRWKKTAEKLTHEELVKFLILAYCPKCDYSEYMVRYFWRGSAGFGEFILQSFHYGKHPHKVEIAFVRVPDKSPFRDYLICTNCGREHTYRTGQGKTTPCRAFEKQNIDKTFKWFNAVMDALGYTPKLTGSGELEGLEELPKPVATKPRHPDLLP